MTSDRVTRLAQVVEMLETAEIGSDLPALFPGDTKQEESAASEESAVTTIAPQTYDIAAAIATLHPYGLKGILLAE